MFMRFWKIIKALTLVFGLLLCFFVFIETVRAYQTLSGPHPVAGWVFLGAAGGLLAWGFVYFVFVVGRRRPVLIAPDIGDWQGASDRQKNVFARYLFRYLCRLSKNPNLDASKQAKAAEEGQILQMAMAGQGDLLEAIERAEREGISPLLELLDEKVEKEIRSSVAVVMAGVTLSPYKAADLLLVIYRNLAMAGRIIRIYNARPRGREQLRILRDIAVVIATVNYINFGKNLIEGLASKVPFIGRFTDDIAQGIGAGFMTSVAGHAAMQRCRAYKGWNQQEAQDTLRRRAGGFYEDVRDMFKKDVLPHLIRRIGDQSRETIETIGTALDDAGSAVTSCIKVPIGVAVTAGATSGKAVVNTSRWTFKTIKSLFVRTKKSG
jgi:hypothetical protein